MRNPIPAFVHITRLLEGERDPVRPPELHGGLQRYLRERAQEIDRWFFAVRSTFALGLIGFLLIDIIQGSLPLALATAVLGVYVAVNLITWATIGQHTPYARWMYMAIDAAFVLVGRFVFQIEIVVDPNATMVGFFTLLLLTYTVYGDPRLTIALSTVGLLAAAGTTAGDLFSQEPLQPVLAAYHTYPIRLVTLVGYLAAFSALTIGLSARLRRHITDHGVELLKRLEASMTSAVERSRREEFEELNRLKRDFISVLSHELRTPLTPLRSSLELLRGSEDPALYAPELLEIAVESTDKLNRLVLDYTQLAELLTEKDSNLSRWNLDLQAFVEVLRGGADFRRVSMAGMDGLCVSVDPKLLAAGLLALLRRAQLVSSASTISLCGFAHSTGVTLSVHDPESFIDRDLSQILDDPFALSSERTFTSQNTGIELILARYALHRTGGALRVTSTERRGTTAFCTLPGVTPGLEWLNREQIEYELESLMLYTMK